MVLHVCQQNAKLALGLVHLILHGFAKLATTANLTPVTLALCFIVLHPLQGWHQVGHHLTREKASTIPQTTLEVIGTSTVI